MPLVGLVEEQQFGIAEQGVCQAEALLHAEGIGAEAVVCPVCEVDLREQPCPAPLGRLVLISPGSRPDCYGPTGTGRTRGFRRWRRYGGGPPGAVFLRREG